MGSIAETLLMVTGELRTSMEARLAARADAKALELEIAQVEALELEIVPVAALGPEIVRVVALERETSEVAIVRVVALEREISEAGIVQVEVLEREIVQVAELEPEIVPVAVALRIKLGTAAHPRGLVPLLAAAEDMAAEVVETTPGPAVAEAATAWAAEE